MTALVVKVLSLLAERQTLGMGQQGRRPRLVPLNEIRDPVRFLLSVQENDGSFGDPNPVLHRGVLVIISCTSLFYSIRQENNINIRCEAKLSFVFNIGWCRSKGFHDSFRYDCTFQIPSIPGHWREKHCGEIKFAVLDDFSHTTYVALVKIVSWPIKFQQKYLIVITFYMCSDQRMNSDDICSFFDVPSVPQTGQKFNLWPNTCKSSDIPIRLSLVFVATKLEWDGDNSTLYIGMLV